MADADEFIKASFADGKTSMLAVRAIARTRKRDFRNEMRIEIQDAGKWNLLTLREDYYLDVKCEAGSYRIYVLIMLNDKERESYLSHGKNYIEALATEIRRFPPSFFHRNESFEVQQFVRLAINKPFYQNGLAKL